ncbi:N-myc-interactor [Genypterus blacodes]|uniref:N-myc-interactor n=1 Tax=Genypterus blacodes TaxID=154954 RepID=UPI003F7643E1
MADFHNSSIKGKVGGILMEDQKLVEAKKELETLRVKVEKAEDVKARLILEKLAEDDRKTKAQNEMIAHVNNQEQCEKDFKDSMKGIQGQITKLASSKQALMKRLTSCHAELESKRAESTQLQQKFKIYAEIPEVEVKYTHQEKEGNDQPIRGVFSISQRPITLLQGGQALVTFEEENVASQILKLPKCSVACENTHLNVMPKRIKLDPAVKFQVILEVSKKKLQVSNAPRSMPVERMRDQLEISFSKPSRGGGEVESVNYDDRSGTGQITFLHSGVAEDLALRKRFCVDMNSGVNVQISLDVNHKLLMFQTFCGTPTRTVLLDGINSTEDDEDLQDHLEIHFQKPSNYGGEIESIKYISTGKMLEAIFCEDMVKTEA